ncbi:MAG TPA: glycosyltransferase family 2 protein [Bryobacteraceae bacterium]|nr:glycosyltransferase family 2 protein [Bryobacteraceae bacterium]
MTCLCLTRNRRLWLPKAIECFLGQTYQHRELLIVADGEDIRDLIPDDPRIRLLYLTGAADIGDKRNFGCDRAAGETIAHWDDDDFSAPERLSDQLQRLEESRKAVTGYHSMRFTDGANWWKYEGTRNYSLGTSLCYRRDWWATNRFPSLQIGEDNQFVATAWSAGQLATADAGDLMHATIHSGNTSPRNITDNWKAL